MKFQARISLTRFQISLEAADKKLYACISVGAKTWNNTNQR
jgi:hypothetical protein